MSEAFVKGIYCTLANTKDSVFTRAFIIGDAVHPILPVYNGQARFVKRYLPSVYSKLDNALIGDYCRLINQYYKELKNK